MKSPRVYILPNALVENMESCVLKPFKVSCSLNLGQSSCIQIKTKRRHNPKFQRYSLVAYSNITRSTDSIQVLKYFYIMNAQVSRFYVKFQATLFNIEIIIYAPILIARCREISTRALNENWEARWQIKERSSSQRLRCQRPVSTNGIKIILWVISIFGGIKSEHVEA